MSAATIRSVEEIATVVADRCHGNRPKGAAPARYAIIWQAARLGALEALREKGGGHDH